mgnify:FL=1
MSLTVEPADGETELLGKTAADLQENVAILGGEITGMLKLVTDYTGFSSVADEQSGNYLALHVNQEPKDATVTVELIGGKNGAVELDDDGLIVLKIADTAKQSVKVTAINGEYTTTKTYSLKGLTLATE